MYLYLLSESLYIQVFSQEVFVHLEKEDIWKSCSCYSKVQMHSSISFHLVIYCLVKKLLFIKMLANNLADC